MKKKGSAHLPGLPNLPASFARRHHLFLHSFVSSDMFLIYCLFIFSIGITSAATTCGYKDGDPNQPRTAADGWACRVDTALGLWGFCPETVISARDCGLAGVCVDSHSCTAGCGRLTDRADITTFSWSVFLSLETMEGFLI